MSKKSRTSGIVEQHPTFAKMLTCPSSSPLPSSPGHMSDTSSINGDMQSNIPSTVQGAFVGTDFNNSQNSAFVNQCPPSSRHSVTHNFDNPAIQNTFPPLVHYPPDSISISNCIGTQSFLDNDVLMCEDGDLNRVPGQIELVVDSNNQVVESQPLVTADNPFAVPPPKCSEVDALIQMFNNLPVTSKNVCLKRLQQYQHAPSVNQEIVNSSGCSFPDLR